MSQSRNLSGEVQPQAQNEHHNNNSIIDPIPLRVVITNTHNDASRAVIRSQLVPSNSPLSFEIPCTRVFVLDSLIFDVSLIPLCSVRAPHTLKIEVMVYEETQRMDPMRLNVLLSDRLIFSAPFENGTFLIDLPVNLETVLNYRTSMRNLYTRERIDNVIYFRFDESLFQAEHENLLQYVSHPVPTEFYNNLMQIGQVRRPDYSENKEEIAKLPLIKLTTDEDCAICLKRIKSPRKVPLIPCKHCFHIYCLTRWRKTPGEASTQCPLCRGQLETKVFLNTAIGRFDFREEYTLEMFFEDFRTNLVGMEGYFTQPEIQNDKQFYEFLANNVWDEMAYNAEYRLPLRFAQPFLSINITNEGIILQMLLQRAGIEMNPGPVQSRPVITQNNNPRVLRLENALKRRDDKIRTLMRKIEQYAKRPSAQMNPQTQGLFDDIRTFAKKAATIPDGETMGGITNDIGRITNFLDSMLPVLQSNFTTTGLIMTERMVSVKDDIIKIILLVLLIKLFCKFQKYRCAIALVLLFICQHYGFHKQIIDLVKELIEKVKQIRPTAQWGEEQVEFMPSNIFSDGFIGSTAAEELIYSTMFQTCGKIVYAIVAFICIKQIPGKKDWDTYLMRLDRLPKAKEGASKIIDYTNEWWNLSLESIKMMVLGKTRTELRSAAGVYAEIDEWAKTVRKYLDLEERNKIDVDVVVATEVEQLWKKGLEFKADPLLSVAADKLVTTTLMAARSLFEYVSTSPIKGGGPKMKPVCVWLCGASGIGKTEMVYPLCIDVLREMGLVTANDYQHQVYARQVETEYWDGYKGQKIVIYDDAFQKKDDKVTGNPELFEVIRSCNTFPQHLHMAALHDKNTFIQAELMIYTTNEMNVDISSLTFPAAFYNRMYENAYIVQPKEQYRSYEQVDGKNVVIGLNLDSINKEVAIDLDIYEFQKMNKNGEAVGGPIDYHTFARMISNQWRNKKQVSMNKLKFLETYATRPFAQMMEAESFQDCRDEGCFDFASDIAKRIARGQSITEIEYEYAQNDSWFADYHTWKKNSVKPPTMWEKYARRIEVAYDEFKAKLNELQKEASKIISEHPYLTVLGFVGVVISAFGLYQFFSDSDSEEGEKISAEITGSGDSRTIRQVKVKTEISGSGDSKTNKNTRVKVELSGSGDTKTNKNTRAKVEMDTTEIDAQYLSDFLNGRNPVAQGCSDPNALSLVTDVLYKNTYKLIAKKNNRVFLIGNVIFLKGWVASIPYHFLHGLYLQNLHDSILYLTQDGKNEMIQFPASFLIRTTQTDFEMTENVVRLLHVDGAEQDCVLFCLHRQMCQPHRNIIPHIVTQADLGALVGSMKGTMSTFCVRSNALERMYHTFGEITPVDSTIEIDLDVEKNIFYSQRSYYTYRVSTVSGDCGSVIAIFSKKMTRKLIGMHIAGDENGIAYACPWTQERIEIAIKKLERIHGPVAQMVYDLDSNVDSGIRPKMPEGGFVPVGKAKFKVGQAVKTTLLKSRIYEKLRKSIMAPAILKPIKINGEIVDPMMNGLKKCGVTPALLDNDDIEACVNDVSRLVRTNFCQKDITPFKKVLTYKEAVMGTDDEFMVSINRTTSPGVPYTNQRDNKPGKTKWLGANETFDFTSKDAKQLQEDVSNLITDCEAGIIRGVYCADTLKDEKRELAKVALGKTRVFSACPVHFVIAFRQYFLGFAAWCMHNRIDNEIAVGTNQYSLDWHKIATRLQLKGKHVIAGDFSNFDGSLNAQILWAILDIIHRWYDDGEQNKRIRTTLWSHIVHSTHVFEDNVYMWTHSQPSGNPFTVIINSLYNSIIMRMAWRIVMVKEGKSGMDNFSKNVSMISYGDDNALNISGTVLQEFNQQTIAEALSTIAHTYTDEGKTGEIIKSRTLNEIKFLKRGFVYSSEVGRYIAPLEENVIYEMLNWTRNTIDPDEILLTNVQTAAREMALHGKHKFSNFKKEISQIEQEFKLIPQILTYGEYLLDMKLNPDEYF